MTHDNLIEIHGLIDRSRKRSLIEACNLYLRYAGLPGQAKTPQEAFTGLYGAFQGFLDSNRYDKAALLCWGGRIGDEIRGIFDPYARSARLIRAAIDESNKVLVIGGAGTGKTWMGAAEIVLMAAEDPGSTEIKVISSTAGHAKNNIMAKIFRLHRESAIMLPGEIKAKSLTFGNSEIITQVAIPEGDLGKGRLTGFHPQPRKVKHPKFGWQTRVAAFIDEADTVPSGLWEGLDNLLISENEQGSVLVVGLTNPRDKSNAFAARAEPVGGFNSIDPDKDDKWISRDGWTVVRLDPMRSENVVERKDVYPGMVNYAGFQNYVRKGKGSPEYWIMGRGWYPEETAEFIVVSSYLFNSAIGVYQFTGDITPVGSFDPAFAEGGDDPMLTAGQSGTAIAFTPHDGNKIIFPTPLHNAIQLEQQFPIRKSIDPEVMGMQVIQICNALNIRPESFVMDRTGNALGLFGWLTSKFGSLMGVEWGSSATELKILEEDTKTAYERYSGINTEMYFAFGLWLQYNRIKFAPVFSNMQRVQSEITNRRYYFYRGMQKLEDKVSFKARNEGMSPDCGDSAVMLSHLVRIRSSQNPSMVPESERKHKKGQELSDLRESITSRVDLYDTT